MGESKVLQKIEQSKLTQLTLTLKFPYIFLCVNLFCHADTKILTNLKLTHSIKKHKLQL